MAERIGAANEVGGESLNVNRFLGLVLVGNNNLAMLLGRANFEMDLW